MPTSTTVADNLQQTREAISTLETQHNREHGSVQLLAVSKRKPTSLIREAAASGQRLFGENYADEGALKIQELSDLSLEWHFIGHVQSNKTRLISKHYDWVQSIERRKIAERLAAHRPVELPPLNICLQVNVDGETTKSGCPPEQLPELATFVSTQERLILRGIMAIPAPRESASAQRDVFSQLHNLFSELKLQHPQLDTLSIGMSGDMPAAIAEGATMVRIGTAIFGKRDS
ncbi:YggS family pyridoxal phosphate enzyme [Chromatiales bacterium (ex Bugula neritina AB1)]|nr:YggS family pyridoxal phosphate enzyme [Chromatiales bacterium (ex Bugula neritina AB1)]